VLEELVLVDEDETAVLVVDEDVALVDEDEDVVLAEEVEVPASAEALVEDDAWLVDAELALDALDASPFGRPARGARCSGVRAR
jgi:hypothetical protein